jgi:hypothetical protein
MEPRLGMIVIDVAAGAAADFDRSFLERNGHGVVVCHGPDDGTVCPLLSGAGCDAVDGAHGVVFALDLDDAQHRAILDRYREVIAPDVPIRVVVGPGQREAYRELLDRFEVWERDPTAADLDGFAAEVEAADRSR